MKGSKYILIIICLLGVKQATNALDLTKINMSYLYDVNADIQMKYRVVQREDKLTLFYQLKAENLNNWSFELISQKNYESEDHETLNDIPVDTLAFESGKMLAEIELPLSVKGNILVFIFTSSSFHETSYFDFDFNIAVGFPSFYPLDAEDLPLFASYTKSDSLKFDSANPSYHIYQYAQSFIGTDPPMGQMRPLAPNLEIDSSYYFKSYLKNLKEDNFYLIQEDSLDQNGITLLKVPSYYPDSKKINELIGPMQYITTKSENKSLNSGVDSKRTFERFWINIYGSKFLAKEAIRSFYGQVRESNVLFTDYKKGWKTDRGMIYIIFGIPNEVIRSQHAEVWKYDDDLRFEFIRISTLFAPSFYSLRRNKKYEEIWYNRIGVLRNE